MCKHISPPPIVDRTFYFYRPKPEIMIQPNFVVLLKKLKYKKGPKLIKCVQIFSNT